MNRLIISDTDQQNLNLLEHALSHCPEFKVIDTADDGLKALELILSHKPDIVLMDLLLPKIDGLFLLKEIQKMKEPPDVVCMSGFYSQAIVEQVRKNGASYFLCKPFESNAVITVLRELADFRSTSKNIMKKSKQTDAQTLLKRSVHEILKQMGFSSKHIGSEYLAESVMIVHDSPMKIRNLSTELYCDIAERMHTTTSCIERCMRTAISAANANGNLSIRLGELPTNKKCIQYILNELHSFHSYA